MRAHRSRVPVARRAASLRAAALGALCAAWLGACPALAEPAPLRIGVAHVPAAADVPAARLYTPEGVDLDLANEIGRRLGRKVVLVEVRPEGTAEAVTSGRVDALVLRLGEGQESPAALELVPSGYASALTVLMRTDTDIRRWEDLRGRTVCAAAANGDARLLAHRLGARLSVQPVPAHSLMRVRTGECDAALHDEATLRGLSGDPEWKKFTATLPPRDMTRLVVALPKAGGAQTQTLRAALSPPPEPGFWRQRLSEWARNVALEVYLDQDAPDCH
ncbi:transporter substrate-binding domain-containing protein [Ancylobacter sp. G4_0304]|uniref:transporter substrate-binding domain-containing protein n=1 Tax=Ancylobacter sp. G4_0304 TaxID=3114289 RepID=UPI0039C5BA6A